MRGERRGSMRGRNTEMNELAFGWCAGAVMVLVFEPTACAILTLCTSHADLTILYLNALCWEESGRCRQRPQSYSEARDILIIRPYSAKYDYN